MKFKLIFLLIFAQMLSGQSPLDYAKMGIELTGFFDIQQQFNLYSSENEGIKYGQFEIGFSKNINSFIATEGAIAYNSESENFELGSAICDIHLLGESDSHLYEHSFILSSGVKIGQFDIPFGLDYKYIPSPDRKFVSTPLIVEKTINAMNNLGISLYAASSISNLNLFVVNGLAEKNQSVGGRLGILPLQNLEIGYSWFTDIGESALFDCYLSGMDIQYSISLFEIRGEYIHSQGIVDGCLNEHNRDIYHDGYYIQVLTHLEDLVSLPVYTGLRVAEWSNDSSNGTELTGPTKILACLAGYCISNSVEARIEYRNDFIALSGSESTITTQIVLSF